MITRSMSRLDKLIKNIDDYIIQKKTIDNSLYIIMKYLQDNLTLDDIQELTNKCNAVNMYCKGDGAGLLGGCLIDMLISKYFENKLSEYKQYKEGEADMMLCNIPLSQKKINGKSVIALDWSKNNNISTKEQFQHHILIINLKTEQWWKNKPNKINANDNINYTNIIKSGIYLIDKDYCKNHVKLSNNNKTNTLITSEYLYKMLNYSIANNLYIDIPKPNKVIEFNILNAFSK